MFDAFDLRSYYPSNRLINSHLSLESIDLLICFVIRVGFAVVFIKLAVDNFPNSLIIVTHFNLHMQLQDMVFH
jgi:hypothetical protein